jgi:hypothetical protein
MMPERKPSQLPMSLSFSSYRDTESGKFVFHALDVDLVSVADTEQEASRKIRLAVKNYIEFGVSNNWVEDIIYPAPKEFWDVLGESTEVGMMEPIKIMDKRMIAYLAKPVHEVRPVAVSA